MDFGSAGGGGVRIGIGGWAEGVRRKELFFQEGVTCKILDLEWSVTKKITKIYGAGGLEGERRTLHSSGVLNAHTDPVR